MARNPPQFTKFHSGQAGMNLIAGPGELAQHLHQGRVGGLIDIAAPELP